MIKRIDLFYPVKNSYGDLIYYTQKFAEALGRQGVSTRILEAEYNNPRPFLEKIFSNIPDCTLSFNGLLPDSEGRFFCDLIKIPHVACLLNSAVDYLPLVQSPLNIITCIDRLDCEFFLGMGFKNSFFMPYAVEKELGFEKAARRNYDVVMIASLIDYVAISDSWKKRYSSPVQSMMQEAVSLTLKSDSISCVQALSASLDRCMKEGAKIDPNSLLLIEILQEIEMCVNGRAQIELLNSIKEAKVHIFGGAPKSTSWQKYLRGNRNISIHDPVPFEQSLEIMKQSKIVLNSIASIKSGGHERVFASLATGALALTAQDLYLKNRFQDGVSIAYYQQSRLESINDQINRYLADEPLRAKVALRGRSLVMEYETWDNRAKKLLEEISPLLER